MRGNASLNRKGDKWDKLANASVKLLKGAYSSPHGL